MTKFLQSAVEAWGVVLAGAGSVKTAKLSHCGDYVAIIDDRSKVHVSRLSTGESWKVPVQGSACSIALNRIDEFTVLSDDGSLQRFDLTLPVICLGKFSVPAVCSLSYDHTGTMLAVAQANGRVRIYDLEVRPTPSLVAMFKVTDRSIPLLCSRLDMLLGVDQVGRLFCLRSPEGEPQILWNGAVHLDLDCYSMAIHPALPRLAVGGFGRYIRYYSAYNLPPAILITSFHYVRDLVFLADTNHLVVIGDSGLEIWSLETNTLDLKWQSPLGRVLCARPGEAGLTVIWS